MKNKFLYILILIALVGIFSLSTNVHAQEFVGPVDPSYHLLAPLPELESFNPTRDTALGSYLNIIIKLIIGLAAVMAVVMIVIGGLEYMTSDLISSKEAGKDRITQAILGLIIAIGAYAILYTINPELLSTDIKIENATIEIDLYADTPQTFDPLTGKYSNGIPQGADWETIAGAPATLPPWVNVSPGGDCKTVGQPTKCTSTRGLSLGIVGQIHNQCPECGTLTITGGTEFWLHGGKTGSTSHQRNSTTVDLHITPALTQYITCGVPLKIGKRYIKNDISYLYEGNHWHAGP